MPIVRFLCSFLFFRILSLPLSKSINVIIKNVTISLIYFSTALFAYMTYEFKYMDLQLERILSANAAFPDAKRRPFWYRLGGKALVPGKTGRHKDNLTLMMELYGTE